MSQATVDLIICWHMHQPQYRLAASGEYALPWTYLHAIKDYTDMAAHIEAHPEVRVVFNFVPVLLDQLEDYAQQFKTREMRDPLLRLMARESLDRMSIDERRFVLERCFHTNHSKTVEVFAGYRRLHVIYQQLGGAAMDDAALRYLSGDYFADLLVWYNLAWTGETVRRQHKLIPSLLAKTSGYTREERLALFDLMGELIAGLITRYAALAQAGRIELSTTPYFHPIAPLLIDFATAREAWPQVTLPSAHYAGGSVRAAWHSDAAIASHTRRFGEAPSGTWPAEGGICARTAHMFAAQQLGWSASGEAVLAHSLGAQHGTPPREQYLYHPYRFAGEGGEITLFFRDDRLSDRIGFEYAHWHANDAVKDFITHLEAIAQRAQAGPAPVVSVILDGENAWESYPYNAYYFLSELYTALSKHPTIRTTTFRDYLRAPGALQARRPLPRLLAGSWVYGTFSTWIGAPEKNRAWELLCEAKLVLDRVIDTLPVAEREAALQQLAICEGSDWFWWPGDYNPSASVQSFDQLYRANLQHLYRLLDQPVPAVLHLPLSSGAQHSEGSGTMRRSA